MIVERKKFITREFIQKNRNFLFLYGDNLDRVGFGGQALEMRGEWNSIGIATKRSIHHSFPNDYFFDTDYDTIPILCREFDYVKQFLQRNKRDLGINRIIVPEDGLGTGLSKLPEYAPKALEFIELRIKLLERL